jgi:DHA3 family macrolide efflux protein-like MFS transporter
MRGFRMLWAGQVVSLLGSGLASFALGVWVYERTGSVMQYAVIFLLALLPGIVMFPVAGMAADRFSRRAILLLCDAAGIACMATLATLYAADALRPWDIYLTTSVASVMGAFQLPAFMSSVPLLVQKKDIDRANGLVTLAQASPLIAPLTAGFLLTEIKLDGIIVVDAVSFAINSMALLAVRIPRPRANQETPLDAGPAQARWSAGWRYVKDRPGLLALLGFSAAIGLCVGFVDVSFTPIVLGFTTARTLGIVMTAGGIGMAAGSVAMTAWRGPVRRSRAVLGFAFPMGVALVLGALRPNAALIAAAAFAFLFCEAVISSSMRGIWQVKVDAELQGRVLALAGTTANAAVTIAYAMVGPIADHVFEPLLLSGGALVGSLGRLMGTGPGRGMALLVLILGVVIIATAAIGCLTPGLRHLDETVPDALPGDEPVNVPASVRERK